MNESTVTWNAKQERLAVLIAGGKSIKSAAAEVECGERTAHDWLADPRYRTFVAEIRGRMLDESVGLLAEATSEAVGTLRALLNDANGNVRLRAATSILDAAVKIREHVELEARMLRIEREQAEDRRAGEMAPRIRIPDVDDRWTRTQPAGQQDS